MSVTIAQVSVSRTIVATAPDDAYAYEFRGPGLVVKLIERATQAIAMRVETGNSASVTFTPLDIPTGGTVSLAGDTLTVTVGSAVVTFQAQEVAGRLRLKYTVQLNSKPASNNARWAIATEGGATFAVLADGTAEIRDAGGLVRYTQPAPTAWDKNGAAIPISAAYANGTLTYAITYPSQGNKYPVTIDPTTVSTSTSGNATRYGNNQKTFRASDGTLCALYYSGTAVAFRTSSDNGATWSSATSIATTSYAECDGAIDSSGNIHVLFKNNSVVPQYVKLTKSGSAYSAGTIRTPVASGNGGNSGECLSIRIDSDGRVWIGLFLYTGSYTLSCYYTTDDGVSWTTSLATFVIPDAAATAHTITRAGNYIVLVWCDGGSTYWRRVSTSGSVGAWSTSSSVSRDVWGDHRIAVRDDASGRAMLAASPAGTDYAIRTFYYTPSSDTWSAGSNIGTSTSDEEPTLARIGDDLYCFWSEYSAASSYAIVYKVWSNSSGTWGSKTTLVTSGANRRSASAGGDSSRVGLIWTEGTSSPYNVQFESISLGGGSPASTPTIFRALLGVGF